jgi:hypothetical protein
MEMVCYQRPSSRKAVKKIEAWLSSIDNEYWLGRAGLESSVVKVLFAHLDDATAFRTLLSEVSVQEVADQADQ